jgi:hypothetical protein
MKEQEQERLRRERLLAVERARKAAEEQAAAAAAAKRQAEERKRQEEKEKEKEKASEKRVEQPVAVPETPAAPASDNEYEAELNAHLLTIEVQFNIRTLLTVARISNQTFSKYAPKIPYGRRLVSN